MVAGSMDVPAEILSRDDLQFAGFSAQRPVPSRPRVPPTNAGLTRRQLDVLAQLMHGKSNKAICRILNLAEPTVKNHVTAILKALKVTNRTEAVLEAQELKWD